MMERPAGRSICSRERPTRASKTRHHHRFGREVRFLLTLLMAEHLTINPTLPVEARNE
jgi:hypothetical protein